MLKTKLTTPISKKLMSKDQIINQIGSRNITLKFNTASQKTLPNTQSLKLIKPKLQISISNPNLTPPKKQNFMFKLKKEAIHRPYQPEDQTPTARKGFSIIHRNLYWRKKKLEQYKKAKNLEPTTFMPKPNAGNKKCLIKKFKSRNTIGPKPCHIKKPKCSLSLSTADFLTFPNQDQSSTSTMKKFLYNESYMQKSFSGKLSPTPSERMSENCLKLSYATMYSRFDENHFSKKSMDSVEKGNLTP